MQINTIKLFIFILSCLMETRQGLASEDAKRLLDDVLSNYNNLVRPVEKPSDHIKVYLGLKLSQIADIEWSDKKLKWDPRSYGNITKINIPSTSFWVPDICLADGDYQITTKTKATVNYDGKVKWEPPMIYKSYCAINIEYYPFDIQDCYMKFGSWTHAGDMIDLDHEIFKNNETIESIQNLTIKKDGSSIKLYQVEFGIDMSDFYPSVEWDVLAVPAQKNIKYYKCCPEPYYDIYFNITIRRKALFYTVNLIIPCVNISFLSVLVFFLPSDSGEKLTLSISILVALLVFYLLLIELIPPTSIAIPLIGKYLLFTLILVNLSILSTIFVLNLHHRKPNTHQMPNWMKRIFIDTLPKLLMIKRPIEQSNDTPRYIRNCFDQHLNGLRSSQIINNFNTGQNVKSFSPPLLKNIFSKYPERIAVAFESIKYINDKIKDDNQAQKEIDDWKYVSMVVDRLLLWIFTSACLIGTFWILSQTPATLDDRRPLEIFKKLRDSY